jgi:membrane protein implicated in regulation of membrane protease activity
MALLVLLLVIAALAAIGILGFVVKVAFGVALGVFLAVVAVGAYISWRVRRAWRRAMTAPQRPTGQAPRGEATRPMQGHSEVTVLRPDRSSGTDPE